MCISTSLSSLPLCSPKQQSPNTRECTWSCNNNTRQFSYKHVINVQPDSTYLQTGAQPYSTHKRNLTAVDVMQRSVFIRQTNSRSARVKVTVTHVKHQQLAFKRTTLISVCSHLLYKGFELPGTDTSTRRAWQDDYDGILQSVSQSVSVLQT